jgi:hypothetical protein
METDMKRTNATKPAERGLPGPTPAATDGTAPGPWTAATELERLKYRLLRHELAQAAPILVVTLRRAANEAAALAWLEPHPLLVFPTLFAELVLAARRRAHKQQLVRARSAELILEAA